MSYPKGRPRTNHPAPVPPLERFWPKVDKVDGDGCWEWNAFRAPSGYGRFSMGGRQYPAHRAGWILLVGPIPDGLFVCHSCDNPPCVRLSHLFLGTPADNMHDRDKKGRHRPVSRPGESHPLAVLTDEKVRSIRALYAGGGVTHAELAAQFGVAKRTIGGVITGSRWGHIPAEAS